MFVCASRSWSLQSFNEWRDFNMADANDRVNPAPASDAAIPLEPVNDSRPADEEDKSKVSVPATTPDRARSNQAQIAKDDEVTAAPSKSDGPPAPAAAKQWGLEPPEILRHLTAEERAVLEKKMRRKIDLRLLPMIIIMYILNYIDRNNIAAARFAGLEDDLNMDEDGTQFSTAVSILFVGYILMQVPSNLFLNKIGKPAIYLPASVSP